MTPLERLARTPKGQLKRLVRVLTNAAAGNRTTAKTKPEGGSPPGLLSPLALRQARHELKSVFAKLNVHRHPEFVALLAMLLPG
jgi:hypothetical protein